MKSHRSLRLVLALLIAGGWGCSVFADGVNLPVGTMEEIRATFPEALRKMGGPGGSEVLEADSGGRMRLKTEVGTVARGTLYSAESFSSALNFVATPVTVTFEDVSLEYPMKASGYVGRFGVAGSSAGALAADDKDQPNTGSAVYVEINRRTNIFRLVQVREGVETTLTQWTTQDLAALTGQGDSINNVAVRRLELTLSASKWRVEAVFVGKQKKATGQTLEKSAEGVFDPAWTAQAWGSGSFVGVEVAQLLSKDAAANEASTELTLGAITISPAPAFGACLPGARNVLVSWAGIPPAAER